MIGQMEAIFSQILGVGSDSEGIFALFSDSGSRFESLSKVVFNLFFPFNYVYYSLNYLFIVVKKGDVIFVDSFLRLKECVIVMSGLEPTSEPL